jgi:hypothetical protein
MKAGDKVLLCEDFNPWALEDEKRSITVKAGTVGVVKDVEQSPSLPPIRKGTVLVDFPDVRYTRYVFPAQVAYLLKIVSPATGHKTRRRTRQEDAPQAQENGAQVTAITGQQDAAARPHKQFRGTDLTQEASTLGMASIQLTCKNDQCPYDKTFEMSGADQLFAVKTFGTRGTEVPKWCPGCRRARKSMHAQRKR